MVGLIPDPAIDVSLVHVVDVDGYEIFEAGNGPPAVHGMPWHLVRMNRLPVAHHRTERVVSDAACDCRILEPTDRADPRWIHARVVAQGPARDLEFNDEGVVVDGSHTPS